MATARYPRRGIYLLPTLFTVGNLFCGYAAAVHTLRGSFAMAGLLIVIAGVLDGLDGRIARLTGSASEFGKQFDSLADIVSFGIAPALLAYQWTLLPLGRIGWLVSFIFLVCAAMRLARFNIRVNPEDRKHFAGLPSPMAAGCVATAAFAFPELPSVQGLPAVMAVVLTMIALLMVSRLRYRSFKEFDLKSRHSYLYVLPLAAVIVAVAVRPKWALLILACGYLFSGPVWYVWSAFRSGATNRSTAAAETEVGDEPAFR